MWCQQSQGSATDVYRSWWHDRNTGFGGLEPDSAGPRPNSGSRPRRYQKKALDINCYGALLIAQQAAKRMRVKGHGSICLLVHPPLSKTLQILRSLRWENLGCVVWHRLWCTSCIHKIFILGISWLMAVSEPITVLNDKMMAMTKCWTPMHRRKLLAVSSSEMQCLGLGNWTAILNGTLLAKLFKASRSFAISGVNHLRRLV